MTRLQPLKRQAKEGSPSLHDAVEAVVGPAYFVDMTFPYAANWCDPAKGTQTMRRTESQPEFEFLQRFRQAGGHAPIGDGTDSIDNDAARAVTVVGIDAIDATSNIPALQESRKALLVQMRQDDGIMALRSLLVDKGYGRMYLSERRGRASFVLLAPRDQIRSRTAGIFELPSPTVIEARAMIHDGDHLSEGNVDYSWLWTGPSTHFRLILPQIAALRPRKAEICIPRSEDPANLDLLRVQADGRPVAHRLERWSETSGKLLVDIPDGRDYCVLSLTTPKMTAESSSGRLLGLCLDKLILTS
jgi:hypothetical protein